MPPLPRVRRARSPLRAAPLALLAVLAATHPAAAAMPGMDAPGWRPMLSGGMPDLPDVAAATEAQRAGAARLLRRSRAGAAALDTPAAARRHGYMPMGVWSRDGVRHYMSRAAERDARTLDPRRPEAVMFWRGPDGRARPAAVMFRASSARRPPEPGGPITRWHAHYRCAAPDRHDPRQMPHPPCGPGRVAHYGASVMLHVWFTGDLATAFAVDAPIEALTRSLIPA